METRSTFDILLDYPKKHGLDYQSGKQHRRLLSPNDPTLATKFVRFKAKEDIWFYACDSHTTNAFMSKTFTGLYCSVDLDPEFSLKAYKKDWFDFILRRNKMKTGNKYVDSKLTVTCESETFPADLLKEEEADLFMKLEKMVNPLLLLVEPDYIPTIEELKGKMVAGLEISRWIHEEEMIDQIMDIGTAILYGLKKNAWSLLS